MVQKEQILIIVNGRTQQFSISIETASDNLGDFLGTVKANSNRLSGERCSIIRDLGLYKLVFAYHIRSFITHYPKRINNFTWWVQPNPWILLEETSKWPTWKRRKN